MNIKNKIVVLSFCLISQILCLTSSFSQNVGINTTGAAPDASAILDISGTTGLLIPRMTTAQRNAIASPVESLLIYNTTTKCYEGYNATSSTWVAFGCIGCAVPTAVTASASPNPICAGSTLTLIGSATGATIWSWTGPNAFSSASQSPTIASITTAGAGVYTLTASNTCGAATAVNTASVAVSALPTTANAGSDINPACGLITATLAGNTPSVGTGAWSVVSGTATITTPSSPTSGVTGLAVPGTATLRWTISNSPCATSTDDVIITTTSCCACCTGTITLSFTGASQTWTVPPGVTSICVDARGAQGGNAGGLGGAATGTLSVTPGEILYIYVGGAGTMANATPVPGGFNGGGNGSWGGSGGGASDVRQGGTALGNRKIVGGGGGGGYGSGGGIGGGPTGGSAPSGMPATGGSQTAGGNCYGALGVGGSNTCACADGGAGGGGYWGGGSNSNCAGAVNGGGGGGSSFIGGVTGGAFSNGARSGNGQVIITY